MLAESEDICKALMTPGQFKDWKRRDETRREFWRMLKGPARRPLGSNANEWDLFLYENRDSTAYLAVQIAIAIEEAELRGINRAAIALQQIAIEKTEASLL